MRRLGHEDSDMETRIWSVRIPRKHPLSLTSGCFKASDGNSDTETRIRGLGQGDSDMACLGYGTRRLGYGDSDTGTRIRRIGYGDSDTENRIRGLGYGSRRRPGEAQGSLPAGMPPRDPARQAGRGPCSPGREGTLLARQGALRRCGRIAGRRAGRKPHLPDAGAVKS